jgi:hypothetical protein
LLVVALVVVNVDVVVVIIGVWVMRILDNANADANEPSESRRAIVIRPSRPTSRR